MKPRHVGPWTLSAGGNRQWACCGKPGSQGS